MTRDLCSPLRVAQNDKEQRAHLLRHECLNIFLEPSRITLSGSLVRRDDIS